MKTSRLFISALAVMAGVLTAAPAINAQENGNRDENGKIVRGSYETNRFGDNWFVGVGAGVNSWLGKGVDGKAGVATDIYVGKWFTPSIGARVGWAGLKNKVVANDGFTACDGTFNCNTIHAELLWNLSNAFSGYKETRTWNVIAYPSFAYMRARSNSEYGAGLGVINSFRVSNRVNINLDLSALATKSTYPHVAPEPNTRLGVMPSAKVGVSVNLGRTNFKRHTSVVPAIVPVPFTEDQYNALQERVNALEKENKDLKAQIEELKNAKPDTVTVKKAGDDYGTWHTSSEFAKKIGKNIKQLFGNTALGHDDTGKDKHWNCQEREGVQTAKHGTNQIFGTNSKGRIKHRRKNRCDSKGDGYRNCDDQ